MTRTSTTAFELGCWKSTVCWLPMLKLCQFTTARCEDWIIVVLIEVLPIVAEPAATAPPTGRAFGAGCAAPASGRTNSTVTWSVVLTKKDQRCRHMRLSSLAWCMLAGFAIVIPRSFTGFSFYVRSNLTGC